MPAASASGSAASASAMLRNAVREPRGRTLTVRSTSKPMSPWRRWRTWSVKTASSVSAKVASNTAAGTHMREGAKSSPAGTPISAPICSWKPQMSSPAARSAAAVSSSVSHRKMAATSLRRAPWQRSMATVRARSTRAETEIST